MATSDDFDATFATLRGMLKSHARSLQVDVDKPGHYKLSDKRRTDRIGRPLFVASVQKKKNYVSLYLMPVYACPDLVKSLSPSLRERMQGKSCFNFTAIDPQHVKELSALTKEGIPRFRRVPLPWEPR